MATLNVRAWLSLAALALVFMLPFLLWRLVDEESVLARELPGYVDYQSRVPCRLVPGIW
jgi:protein-S-isoprenylcysteine O-methyltransferase Ste14